MIERYRSLETNADGERHKNTPFVMARVLLEGRTTGRLIDGSAPET